MSERKRDEIKQPPGTPAHEPNAPVEAPDDAAQSPRVPVREPEPKAPERLRP